MKFPYLVLYDNEFESTPIIWIVNPSIRFNCTRFNGESQIITVISYRHRSWDGDTLFDSWFYGYSENGQLLMWRRFENCKLKKI